MPTRRARLRRRIYAILPAWLKNHDFEVFAAVLGIFAGAPILFGQVEPASPEELLPWPIVYMWALTLVVGCILILVALVAGSKVEYPKKMFWARMEAWGLSAIAYFCYIYFLCIMIIAASSGWTAGIIVLAFGCISHIRHASIHDDLENYRRSLGLTGKA